MERTRAVALRWAARPWAQEGRALLVAGDRGSPVAAKVRVPAELRMTRAEAGVAERVPPVGARAEEEPEWEAKAPEARSY